GRVGWVQAVRGRARARPGRPRRVPRGQTRPPQPRARRHRVVRRPAPRVRSSRRSRAPPAAVPGGPEMSNTHHRPADGQEPRASEFDHIVVGGGSGGAVVAARLSEDPTVRVALVEAGPDDRDIPEVLQLDRWMELLESGYDWDYPVEPQEVGN